MHVAQVCVCVCAYVGVCVCVLAVSITCGVLLYKHGAAVVQHYLNSRIVHYVTACASFRQWKINPEI